MIDSNDKPCDAKTRLVIYPDKQKNFSPKAEAGYRDGQGKPGTVRTLPLHAGITPGTVYA